MISFSSDLLATENVPLFRKCIFIRWPYIFLPRCVSASVSRVFAPTQALSPWVLLEMLHLPAVKCWPAYATTTCQRWYLQGGRHGFHNSSCLNEMRTWTFLNTLSNGNCKCRPWHYPTGRIFSQWVSLKSVRTSMFGILWQIDLLSVWDGEVQVWSWIFILKNIQEVHHSIIVLLENLRFEHDFLHFAS